MLSISLSSVCFVILTVTSLPSRGVSSNERFPTEMPECFKRVLEETSLLNQEHENKATTATSQHKTRLLCIGSQGDKVSVGHRSGCFSQRSCDIFLSVQSTQYGFKFWDVYIAREEGFPVQGVKLFISKTKTTIPRSLQLTDTLIAEGIVDSSNRVKSRSFLFYGENDEGSLEEIDKSSDQFSFKVNGNIQAGLVDINSRLYTHFAFYTIEMIRLSGSDDHNVNLESEDFYPYAVTFIKDGNDSIEAITARVLQLDHPVNLRDEFEEDQATLRVDSFIVPQIGRAHV